MRPRTTSCKFTNTEGVRTAARTRHEDYSSRAERPSALQIMQSLIYEQGFEAMPKTALSAVPCKRESSAPGEGQGGRMRRRSDLSAVIGGAFAK